jgi:enediyne biosynthesis protein E4
MPRFSPSDHPAPSIGIHLIKGGTPGPCDQRYDVRRVLGQLGAWLATLGCLVTGCSRPAAPVPLRFRDVTRAVGLDFVHENGASPRKYFIETMGSGVAFLDYNNDGWLDLLCVNGKSLAAPARTNRPSLESGGGSRAARRAPSPAMLALYRNVGGQRFENVTGPAGLALSGYGMGCAVGDFDNDGWDDLYVSAVLGPGHLFHNRQGRFEEVTERAGVGNAGKWGTSCAWLDYDRDGRLDLFVVNYVRYAGLGDDKPCYVRGRRTYCIPQPYEGSASVLYHNEGDGRFRDVTRSVGLHDPTMKALGVAVADFDQDGWPDLFVANDTVPNRLFHNERGRFTEIGAVAGMAFSESGAPRAGMGIDAAAWRGPASFGVAVTNFTREAIGLFDQTQPRAASFRDVAEAAGIAAPSRRFVGFGIGFLDADNDGDADLIAVNGHVRDDVAELEEGQQYAEPALLFQNDGQGHLHDVSAAAGPPISEPRVGRGMACGDYDNDGRVDVLISENGGPARLWHNETASHGHWLRVQLEGERSNRDGLGAAITLAAGGQEQVAWTHSGSSYLSASDRGVHFGLGRARSVDRIEVAWPSGARTTLRNEPVDRVLHIREPAAEGGSGSP